MMGEFKEIKEHLITYNPAGSDSEYVKAEGIYYYDADGNKYLCFNEISLSLGFDHPKFTKGVSERILTRMMAHGGSVSKEKDKMIGRIMEKTHGDFDKFFMAASGGEVVDWSLKIARRVTGRDGIVSFHNALHGRSFAGAFISGTPLRKEGFGSGLSNIYFMDFPGDGRQKDESLSTFPDVAAVIIEPYQAIGGMRSPSKEYYRWLREYTREHGILLIMDEVQTGFGKTGSFFAYEESGIVPDILLLGKGMSNGFGLGALLMTKEVGSFIKPFEMSGGSADNDFMCSVVNLVLDIFEEEEIIAHTKKAGAFFREKLYEIFKAKGIPLTIHGSGLFMSLQFEDSLMNQVIDHCRRKNILIGRSKEGIMVRPPLVITEEELLFVAETMGEAL